MAAHIKRYSISLATWEMKIATTIRDQYIPIVMAQNEKSQLHEAETVFVFAHHLIYKFSTVPGI